MDEARPEYERIYRVVCQIPRGVVTTYGDVAKIAGGGIDARTVGEALNALPKDRAQEIPWQRVINARGGISTRGMVQRTLLEEEGIVFGVDGRTDLRRFGWAGPSPEWCAANGCTPLPPRSDPQAEQLPLF